MNTMNIKRFAANASCLQDSKKAGTAVPFVTIAHLVKDYTDGARQHTVLKDVSFTLERGEIVALMGASGSGKSTLLHLLSGLDRPTSGKIQIGGTELTGRSDKWLTDFRRRHIGLIYQFFNLVPLLTVRENLLVYRLMEGKAAGRDLPVDFFEVVQSLQLEDVLDAFPDTLSGGQQQRVAVGRAILAHPDLLLADEPTGSLDSANAEAVLTLLQTLCHRYRQTALVVTHAPEIAARCDRILHIRDGQVGPEGGTRP